MALLEEFLNSRDNSILCDWKADEDRSKSTSHIKSRRPLELFHMDLMGPVQVESIGGKKYVFVCVDDYSHYSCVDFLTKKSDVVKSVNLFVYQTS